MYSYTDSEWGDLLTAYQGGSNSITYDSIGNPINIYGTNLTWQGRRLTSYTSGSNVYSYTYNADGIRTSKTVNGVTHNYVLEGSNILAETYGNTTLRFVYDNTGVIGLYYNNILYMFEKNMHGDVVAILDSNLTRVVEYAYDAWGNVLNVSGSLASTLGAANPIRYRSYYYDTETGWYYLQSRYYNPTWGRFISADNHINANGDLIGFNMFAYCSNNPVMFVDPCGECIHNLSTYKTCEMCKRRKKVAKKVWNFIENIPSAYFKSFEVCVGMGPGIGTDISDNITLQMSQELYVGLDDGQVITGNRITAEASILDIIGIGETYNHLVEKGGERVTSSGDPDDKMLDMLKYPDTKEEKSVSFSIFAINEEGEFLITIGAGAFVGYGGSVNLSFNVSEYLERLFD